MRNEKGQFKKGNPGKPKGAKSKKNAEIRNSFKMLIENNLDKLEDDLNQLKPKERLDVIMNLANYIIPKLKATEMTFDDKTENQFRPIEIIERVIIDNTKDNENK